MTMTSRERMLTALNNGIPDRLPVTTHHLMPYFLDKYMSGCSEGAFFDHFGLDAITWFFDMLPDPLYGTLIIQEGFTQIGSVIVTAEVLPHAPYESVRYTITMPGGNLSMVLATDQYTTWITERLIKNKQDIDILGAYLPAMVCDRDALKAASAACADRGIVRGSIPGFPLYGQPGCWQDAACLVGIEQLILATYDDPGWVHALLRILQDRKKRYIHSLEGAPFDLIELGGGDASSSVVSPQIFNTFVAPYDAELIALAHAYGQRIVYHTCGGMMPILEAVADMGPDVMETFTPPGMGGDTDLAQARARIGQRVCMIGGFDQFHHLQGCSAAETRRAVRHCFDAAGQGGGYILCPSDHFFDAEPALIHAFADEARQCRYT